MGRLVDSLGRTIPSPDDPNTEPKMLLDTPEGRFSIPVVVLTAFQYQQLVADIGREVRIALGHDVPEEPVTIIQAPVDAVPENV